MPRRTARRLVVLLSATVMLATAGAVDVSAATYPDGVDRSFQKSCVKAAKKQGAPKKKAKAYCRAAFNCIEDKLSLKRFKELTQDGEFASNKKVQNCIQKASAKLQ